MGGTPGCGGARVTGALKSILGWRAGGRRGGHQKRRGPVTARHAIRPALRPRGPAGTLDTSGPCRLEGRAHGEKHKQKLGTGRARRPHRRPLQGQRTPQRTPLTLCPWLCFFFTFCHFNKKNPAVPLPSCEGVGPALGLPPTLLSDTEPRGSPSRAWQRGPGRRHPRDWSCLCPGADRAVL